MKIIIAVPSADNDRYNNVTKALKETCYSNIPDSFEVFYLYNVERRTKGIDGNNFYENYKETVSNMIHKTISFFEYCYENLEFDYIFRTNTGSYIDLELLEKYIKSRNINHNQIVAKTGWHESGLFVSGAGYLLTRSLVEYVVKNKHNMKLIEDTYCTGSVLDDLTISRMFFNSNLKVEVLPALRKDIEFLTEINDLNIDDDCYHYYFTGAEKWNVNRYHKLHKLKLKRKSHII